MRLYHNPRCSKSRQAVEILKSNNIQFEEYKYLELGICEQDLELLSSLPNILRKSEKEFNTIDYDLSDPKNICKALIKLPKLLQRPVLVYNGKAVIGRPPENILAIIKIED